MLRQHPLIIPTMISYHITAVELVQPIIWNQYHHAHAHAHTHTHARTHAHTHSVYRRSHRTRTSQVRSARAWESLVLRFPKFLHHQVLNGNRVFYKFQKIIPRVHNIILWTLDNTNTHFRRHQTKTKKQSTWLRETAVIGYRKRGRFARLNFRGFLAYRESFPVNF